MHPSSTLASSSAFRKLALLTIAASASVMVPIQAGAVLPPPTGAPALSFTGGSPLNLSGFDETAGWAFTLSTPKTVTQLGFWDSGNDGLAAAQTVAIWTSDGVLQVTATVPAGIAATLLNGFRYTPVTPILLPAGSYTIGAFSLGSPDFFTKLATITTDPAVTYAGSRIDPTPGGIAFPVNDNIGFPNSYLGPNFRLVPEPASGALLGLGTLLLSARRRRAQV